MMTKEKPTGEEKQKLLGVVSDLVLSILSIVIFNSVLQFFVYPLMEKRLGSVGFGNAQTLFGIIAIMATTFGTGANYARMVAKNKGRDKDGDFNVFLVISCLLSGIITGVLAYFTVPEAGIGLILFSGILSIFSILRYYGDVEFRLRANFKKFFVYYMCLAVGYVLGWIVLLISGEESCEYVWPIAILLGEVAAIGYVFARGSIFRGKDALKKTNDFGENFKTIMFLALSNFIGAFVLQADKIMLRYLGSSDPDVAAHMVTIYYTATLVGKIVAMLTTPLNSIIITYLSKLEKKFTKKMFTYFVLGAFLIGIFFLGFSVLGSHFFVHWKYLEVYDQSKQYFVAANAGQILYFISGSLLVVVLKFMHEKYQLIINGIYAGVFVLLVVPAVIFGGLWGITWGLLAVNAIRMALVIFLGYKHIGKDSAESEEGKNEEN